MTPWAELLLRPVDATDEVVRRRFHELSRTEHPDALDGAPGPRWFALVAAYQAIKTQTLRDALAKSTQALSALCSACSATGVVGTRIGGSKVRLCAACRGEGRAAFKPRSVRRAS